MNFLFLRAKIDQNELNNRANRPLHDFSKVDDVWTLLAHKLHEKLKCKTSIVLYEGPKSKRKYFPDFQEWWVDDFKTCGLPFIPHIIFSRGGFPFYHSVLEKAPRAFKIYYGAGRRWMPQPGFSDYQLVIVDSNSQYKSLKYKYKTILWAKPCADNIFKKMNVNKKYDLCFIGNSQPRKGYELLRNKALSKYSILHIGRWDKNIVGTVPHNVIVTGPINRQQVCCMINLCKVMLVLGNERDSCPRVIPEALACGLPILVRDKTHLWTKKYIPETGEVFSESTFLIKLNNILTNYQTYDTVSFYKNNCSLDKASTFLAHEISSHYKVHRRKDN